MMMSANQVLAALDAVRKWGAGLIVFGRIHLVLALMAVAAFVFDDEVHSPLRPWAKLALTYVGCVLIGEVVYRSYYVVVAMRAESRLTKQHRTGALDAIAGLDDGEAQLLEAICTATTRYVQVCNEHGTAASLLFRRQLVNLHSRDSEHRACPVCGRTSWLRLELELSDLGRDACRLREADEAFPAIERDWRLKQTRPGELEASGLTGITWWLGGLAVGALAAQLLRALIADA